MNIVRKNRGFHAVVRRYYGSKSSLYNKKGWEKNNSVFINKKRMFLQEAPFSSYKHKGNSNDSTYKKINEREKKRPFFLTWKCFAFNLLLAIPIFYLYVLEDQKKKRKVSRTTVNSVGKPLIGGDFTLINQKGEIVTNKSFKNKFCLIYFGFTYCPDICPQELEKQTIVIERLTKKYGDIIVPIFISVDPKRDTVAQISHYCKSFSPHLIGLTGTMELIRNVAKKYRVYFNENITNEVKEGDGEEDKVNQYNYLIDHSIIHYLLNTEGEFVDFFGKNCTINEMVEKIGEYLDEYVKKKNEQQLVTVDHINQ